MQTGKRNAIPTHFGKFEKLGLIGLGLTPPSETIAVNDPVIGDYTYIVYPNLVTGANEGLASSFTRLLAAAARLLVGRREYSHSSASRTVP